MKIIRHARHSDRVRRIEGALAIAGVGGGVLLWSESAHLIGYGFAAAAFLSLGGINSGVKALRNYNRHHRGAEGEQAVIAALRVLPDGYTCITNFVVPGTRNGDTDLLVIGPHGVAVVEVKSYTGHFACQGDIWYQIRDDGSRQPLRGSVSRQLKRNRKAVQHYLVDCDHSLPVYAVAVFRETAHLDLNQPTVPVMSPQDLSAYIKSLPARHEMSTCDDLESLFAPTPKVS